MDDCSVVTKGSEDDGGDNTDDDNVSEDDVDANSEDGGTNDTDVNEAVKVAGDSTKSEDDERS